MGVRIHAACGPRDVLIIASSEGLEGPDIVPRRPGQLSPQDQQRLSSQGIPEQCGGDDVKLMEERYTRDARFSLVPKGSKEVLTCEYVKAKIHAIMNNTTKPGGIGMYTTEISIIFTLILHNSCPALHWSWQERHWGLVLPRWVHKVKRPHRYLHGALPC